MKKLNMKQKTQMTLQMFSLALLCLSHPKRNIINNHQHKCHHIFAHLKLKRCERRILYKEISTMVWSICLNHNN